MGCHTVVVRLLPASETAASEVIGRYNDARGIPYFDKLGVGFERLGSTAVDLFHDCGDDAGH